MSARAFIPDGYTEKCYFKGVPRIYEEVRFSFRPVPSSQARSILNGFSTKAPNIQEQIADETLVRHLVEWDLKDDSGQPVAINKDNLRRIKLVLKERLFDVVTGYSGGDEDPSQIESSGEEGFDYDKLVGNEEQAPPQEASVKN